ncbi:hypothetical protein EWM64_g207 [Hericium alpestre]|uniref:Transaldolase n=1 Tax=Hericium alpestre TaxID=135208 RepID=A0A4Z0A9L7_9AGAM|nr:hypothetical protein EWM64_g207 [Hericium alpestre]
MSTANLLADIRARVVVDVDSMDPDVAARHTDLASGQQFSDMTSNQAIAYGVATRPDRAGLIKAAVKAALPSGGDLVERTEPHIPDDAIDHFTVLLGKAVLPYLTGRLHAQTSPLLAYDTEATIAHAKRLVATFEAHGTPRSRVCIKIPATPEAIVACQYLEKTGIRTLATCLFSVAQAEAASEAGCLYIAPYFNELRVHFDPSVWKEYKDPAREHPMSLVITDILNVYKQIGSKTLVMPASLVTAAEVEGLASLGINHITLSGAILDKLAALSAPASHPEPPAQGTGLQSKLTVTMPVPNAEQWWVHPAPSTTSYLANGGAQLREALAADIESTRKLDDALKIFIEMEEKLRDIMRKEIAALST